MRAPRGTSRKTWLESNRIGAAFAALAILGSPLVRADGPSPVFGYTHLMPSPLTLPAGRLAYGTAFSFGVTSFLQLGTDVVRDAVGILNANAKIGVVETRGFAAALTLGFEKFNFRDFSAANPDVDVTSWEPGIVAAVELSPGFAWFVGANFDLSRQSTTVAGTEISGLARGAAIASDISWAYEAQGDRGDGRGAGVRRRGIGNVMSAGITYDVTYRIFGAGLSHHWPGFQLGLHYYPDAATQKVLPIVVGGGSVDL